MKKILKEFEEESTNKIIEMRSEAKALINKCNGFLEATDVFESFTKNMLVKFLGKYANFSDNAKEELLKEIKNEEKTKKINHKRKKK